jgi:chromosome partitioning protein
MRVITLASRKGGTGKTTLAINLAAIANRNERACVIDMDPQQSTDVWKRLRAKDETLPTLSIGSCRPARLPQLLRELRNRNMRWVFIDTPPSLMPAVEIAIQHADLVVLNEAPPLREGVASPMVKEARSRTSKAAELYAGRIWKHQLTHRNAIATALTVGHVLNDRQSYEAACLEFEALWRQLRSLVRRVQ